MEYSVSPVKSQPERSVALFVPWDFGALSSLLRGRARKFDTAGTTPGLKDFVLAAEISEGADVGDDESGGEPIFGADLAEVDAAVLEGEAATTAIVAHLHELALQSLVGEVIAYAGGEIETLARQISVAKQ